MLSSLGTNIVSFCSIPLLLCKYFAYPNPYIISYSLLSGIGFNPKDHVFFVSSSFTYIISDGIS